MLLILHCNSNSLTLYGADSGADGVTDPHADLAVCHDRPGGHPGDHPPQHLGGARADPGAHARRAEDRRASQAHRRGALRYSTQVDTSSAFKNSQWDFHQDGIHLVLNESN